MAADLASVFIFGLITALATGLGALPFFFLRTVSDKTIAMTHAVASGLMLGASFGLIVEGSSLGVPETVIGGAAGVVFILLAERWLRDKDIRFGELTGVGAKQTLLVLAIMTLHSFSEGVAVGVAFGGGQKLATLITVAIAIHNIPEGLAISTMMRPRGSSVSACAGWSIFSSLPQPLMAVPAFFFVEAFTPVLPYGLGFAAGAMVFMVFLELLPEAYRNAGPTRVGLILSFTLAAMILLQKYL
jgi:zinc transporter ZupT